MKIIDNFTPTIWRIIARMKRLGLTPTGREPSTPEMQPLPPTKKITENLVQTTLREVMESDPNWESSGGIDPTRYLREGERFVNDGYSWKGPFQLHPQNTAHCSVSTPITFTGVPPEEQQCNGIAQENGRCVKHRNTFENRLEAMAQQARSQRDSRVNVDLETVIAQQPFLEAAKRREFALNALISTARLAAPLAIPELGEALAKYDEARCSELDVASGGKTEEP